MRKKINLGKKVIWLEIERVDFKNLYFDIGKGYIAFQIRKFMFDFMIIDKELEEEIEEWLEIMLKDVDNIEKKL